MFGRGSTPSGLVAEQIALVDRVSIVRLEERVAALDRLMEAKFVRIEELTRFQAEKVALALAASQQAIDKADTATEKAIIKAEAATEKRFESVNEFRQTLSDQTATFLPRPEFAAFKDRHAAELGQLKERMDKSDGTRTGTIGTWGAVVGAVTLIVIIVNVIIYAFSNSNG